MEEPVHSPVFLTLPGDSDSRRVMLWTVTWCLLFPQSCIRIILGVFPGSADVTVQKALLPPQGSFHTVSIPVGVPCWGPPVSQSHHPCFGQMEQVGKEKTPGLLTASTWHPRRSSEPHSSKQHCLVSPLCKGSTLPHGLGVWG